MRHTEPVVGARRLSLVQAVGLVWWTAVCVRTYDLARVQHASIEMWMSDGAFQLARDTLLQERVATSLAVLVCGFLWLTVTGWFDRDPRRRSERWVLAPLGVALILRLGVVPRSIEEIEIHLYDGRLPTMHSYVVPLLGRVVRALPGDGHRNAFVLAGLLSALATVPLQRWATRRSGSVTTGLLVAMAYAAHPIVARFGPTDAPYGLMAYTFFVSVALLSAATPSVVAGSLSLALAVSCRADGVLLVPVAGLLLGRTTLRELWRSHRQALLVGAVLASMTAGASWWVLLRDQYTVEDPVGRAFALLPPISPRQLLWDTLALGGGVADSPAELAARRVWQALVLLGAFAGLLDRRLRWATAALLGALLLAAPYDPFSWTWPVALHRVVPPSMLLAVAAGGGLAALVRLGERGGPRAGRALFAVSVAIPVVLAATSTPFLTRRWSFNVEWEMVRDALAPSGVEDPTCTVMGFGAKGRDDLDIHDFGQMLFGVDMVDCWRNDCVALARDARCTHYIRGLRCYAASDTLSAECVSPSLTGADALAKCLTPACATVESALTLKPVEEREIVPALTFEGAPMRVEFPTVAKVGVYQVVGASGAPP